MRDFSAISGRGCITGYETSILEIISRTCNVKSVRFPRTSGFNYRAGQFMFVTIRGVHGELGKYFSISSSPTEKDLIEFTKKLSGSEYSKTLNALKVGDWSRLEGPYGDFTFGGEFEKLGLLSGGIGITPLRSICKYCTDMRLETSIVLLYGNRDDMNIAFKEDLEEMQAKNSNLKIVFTVNESSPSWKGKVGLIDSQMIETEILDFMDRIFYTCGPQLMVAAIGNELRNIGVPQKQIRVENFTGSTT
ncbi:FAD-dependent oxidoreductase [Candidatus Bathyarchaeota archaeon]|nr:FAD-dependent oxidoreductase [Candidatus Bathyarchaeota archaeon]